MKYVMTDLHGMYDKYLEMLCKINFSDNDIMYILGDICDRGPDSSKIYLDIMSRSNIYVLKGNHEEMAEPHLGNLLKEYSNKEPDILELYLRRDLWLWFANGGDSTVVSVFKECPEDRIKIYEFIKNLPYYYIVDVDGVKYILVHGGVGDYKKGTPLDEISKEDLLWSRPDFDATYFDAKTKLIVGHTPTFMISEQNQTSSIYYGKGNVIDIDCGVVYSSQKGRLACLCLDTGEEFYV